MLTLWRPSRDLFRWDLDDLFGRPLLEGSRFTPAVDIEEQDDRFVLRADLPGIREKDLDLQVHDGTLRLTGKREDQREEKRGSATFRERTFGGFTRQFTLGPNVDAEKIEASYEDGVLTVVLPKKEAAKPRQIPVKVQ